jgi:hypothetical protein
MGSVYFSSAELDILATLNQNEWKPIEEIRASARTFSDKALQALQEKGYVIRGRHKENGTFAYKISGTVEYFFPI